VIGIKYNKNNDKQKEKGTCNKDDNKATLYNRQISERKEYFKD